MIYKVITNFTDLQDNNHRYITGDKFPRDGYEVSSERLKELSTDMNRRGKPVIVEEVPEEAPKKPKKGGKKKNVE